MRYFLVLQDPVPRLIYILVYYKDLTMGCAGSSLTGPGTLLMSVCWDRGLLLLLALGGAFFSCIFLMKASILLLLCHIFLIIPPVSRNLSVLNKRSIIFSCELLLLDLIRS